MENFKQGSENIKEFKGELSKLMEADQVKAVEQGIKPIAMTSTPYETNLSCLKIDLPLLTTQMINGKRMVVEKTSQPTFIYYQQDQEFNAHRMVRMLKNYNTDHLKVKVGEEAPPIPTNLEDEDYHREMGKLLGYTEKEIREYLRRINR